MVELFIHYMAPIMFASLVIFLLLGYPAAFSLAANGLIFALIGIELGLFRPDFLQALPERVYGVMNNDTLLAIPFFTFMGLILERSGMAEDLLDTIGQLFGAVRGGLAYAVIFVGALLAATTGVVAASVISMGLISLPIMLRYGYDRRVASGVIAASGTLAQIIPPSLVLIVMADQLGRSVGDMYEGAFIPGLVLAGLYAVYVFLVTLVFPKSVPGLPAEAQRISEDPARFLQQSLFAAIGLFAAYALIPFVGQIVFSLYDGIASQRSLPALDSAWGETLLRILQVLAFIAFLYRLIRTGPATFGANARLNLLGLAAIAGVVAVLIMMRTDVKAGADFVVLTMFFGIMFAFAVAVLNWVCNRALGFRFLSQMAEQVTFVMVPPLFLIFLVLGTIFIGVATPTEGGAMGATGALILATIKGRLRWDLVRQAVQATAKLSAFVVFILIGARVFSLTFYGVDGHRWVENLLVSLPGGQLGLLSRLRERLRVRARILPRFFRAGLHCRSIAWPGRGETGDRPHLVRSDARREHSDLIHASAVRIRAVLSALGGAQGRLCGSRHRQADGGGDDRANLLGGGAVRDHPADCRRHGDRISQHGDAL